VNKFQKQIERFGLDIAPVELVRKQQKRLVAASCVLFAILPLLLATPYYVHILVLAFLYVVLALGLSVVVGFAGLLNLGYVAFYAIGAYSYALLSIHLGVPFGFAILLGGVLAALFSIIVGIPTLRARGDYIALVTLGFGEITRLLIRNLDPITGGPRGIANIPPPSIFGFVANAPIHFYYIIYLLTILTILFVVWMKNSSMGLRLKAIRDDEIAAESVGIDTARWKINAFVVSAFFAGVMGTFFASWQRFVSPESFTIIESIIILSMVVLGGMDSIVGIIASAMFLVLLPELLRGFLEYRMLLFGAALIIVVIFQHKRERGRSVKRDKLNLIPDLTRAVPSSSLDAKKEFSVPKANAGSILTCQQLHKHFNGIRALDGLSLDVFKGEILGILGPNGAGKTTLFNCLSGVTQADTGLILFEGNVLFNQFNVRFASEDSEAGHRPRKLKPHQICHLGVARTFQNVRVFGSMTVFQNAVAGLFQNESFSLAGSIRKVLSKQRSAKLSHVAVDEFLELLGLHELTNIVVTNLPLALQRKVEIARALATHPKLLLLDEPAAGLNEREKDEFKGIVENIRTKLGLTILLIEHDMSVLMGASDRVVCMNRGRIIAEGGPTEISQNAVVQEAYLGSDDDLKKGDPSYA